MRRSRDHRAYRARAKAARGKGCGGLQWNRAEELLRKMAAGRRRAYHARRAEDSNAQLMGAEGSEIPGSDAQIEIEESWVTPPFQPLRALGAALLTASGFGLYEFVLVSFWSAPWMGIHDRIPWPAFALLAVAMLAPVGGIRLALRLDSPHAKMGFGLFAFLACVVVGMGGGRFISYAMRGTLNPPYKLNIAVGERFPAFALLDQNRATHRGPVPADADATLIYVYRGDFCPFARFELGDLSRHGDEFR